LEANGLEQKCMMYRLENGRIFLDLAGINFSPSKWRDRFCGGLANQHAAVASESPAIGV